MENVQVFNCTCALLIKRVCSCQIVETTGLKHDGPISFELEDNRFILIADRVFFDDKQQQTRFRHSFKREYAVKSSKIVKKNRG